MRGCLFSFIFMCMLSHCCAQLFVAPWTIDCQAPLSMECPGKNTGVGSHSLLQDIFPTQGLNLGLLYRRQILDHLSHHGSPYTSLHAVASVVSDSLQPYGL